jgi:ABC-type uncharacterized transport system substrate-binding protein
MSMVFRDDRFVTIAAAVAGALAGSVLVAAPAAAHPHVWVEARAELVYAPGGQVSAVRHRWTFDEGYSSFAVQGLDTDKNGVFSREELAELAKINAESLAEFGYFTVLKADGKRQDFTAPKDPVLDHDGKALTLSFLLPVKDAVAAKRTVILDVFDPTFFVDFSYAPDDRAVTLAGAPQGCAVQVSRPKKPDPAQQKLSEDFFANANMGLQFASKVIVACP